MNNLDKIALSSARGHVKGSWIQGLDAAYPAFDIHNTMSYTAADVLAAAYGGDMTRVPKYIGFIYNQANEPSSLGPIDRSMDLLTLDDLCQSINGNMQVVRFSRKPSVGTYASFGMDPDYDPEYELVPIYSDKPTFSEWTISPPGRFTEVIWGDEYGELEWLLSFDEYPLQTHNHDPNATSVSAEDGDETVYTATRTRTDIVGYKRVPKNPEDSSESNLEPTERYKGNVVEFSAISRTGRDGIYANDINAGTPYCGPLQDGNFIYRAVLLGDGPNPCGEESYTVLAMVDLTSNGAYRKKPEGYELALDWRVSFE